jgi:hypothetical protein
VRPTDFAKQKPEVPLAMAKRVEVLKNVALIGGWQKEESTKRKKKKNLLPLILLSPDSPEEEGRKEKEEKKDDDKTPGLVPGPDTSAYPQTNKEKKGGKFPKREKIETVKRKKEVPFGFCSFVSLSSSTPRKKLDADICQQGNQI